jgi:hypothetical protein
MATDVVYHLGTASKWQNNEIRYSIRALEKNFLDLGRIFVVGFCPPWLTGVVHLDVPDRHKHNKDANLIDKVLAACDAGVSDQFVRSSDDEMILMPSHVADLKPYHAGNLQGRGKQFWRGGWRQRLQLTMELLKSRGLPTLHYDTHLPKVFDRELFRRVMSECQYQRGNGFTIDTLYLNHAGLKNPPRLTNQKVTMEAGVTSAHEVRKRISGKRYLGYNDSGLTVAFKQVLQEMFPVASKFEKSSAGAIHGIGYDATNPQPTVVAVLGSNRSGSSCVAGVLHLLGVSMGERFQKPDKANPKGYFEALGLKPIVRKRQSSRARVQELRKWRDTRARTNPTIFGGKYYQMCHIVSDLAKAWPGMKVIATDRPVAEILASIERAGFRKQIPMSRRESRVRRLIADRDRDLAALKIPTLRVAFSELVLSPMEVIDKIVEFLGISPTEQQRADAAAFVDPKLKHFP